MAAMGCRTGSSLGGQITLEMSGFRQTICHGGFLVGRSSMSQPIRSQLGCPQLDTCDTAVGLENQPTVTGGRT